VSRLLVVVLLLPLKLQSQFPAREYAERRQALASRIPDAVVVVFGAAEPAEDYLSFYQNPPMLYLTGVREPDAALVMVRRAGQTTSTVYVQPRDPAREVWTGTRMGMVEAARRTGLAAADVSALPGALDSLAGLGVPFLVAGSADRPVDGADRAPSYVAYLRQRHPQLQLQNGERAIEMLRGKKSAGELSLIRRAIDITVLAENAAIPAIHPGMNEFEIQALIEYVFRRNGSERPSFSSIVGSGPNSTTLHYNADDRFIQPGDVVVMDIGASYKGYAADVTRTAPASGTFSPAQREIYQLVRDAQAAAEKKATPGARAADMEEAADAALAAGLARLGLIESADATYDAPDDHGGTTPDLQLRLYYMHGIGHGIGLEVHDPDQFYFTGVLALGSVFTIEPGIYVRSNLLDILPDTPRNRALISRIRPAVEKYRNIGVRIEDDYAVTANGVEWLSRAPRELVEIEALMKNGAMPVGRDTNLVRSYRDTLP
jgi:Xaa-Pro aminopeptidase